MPLTHERLLWVESRIFTLALMVREFTNRQTRYQTNPRFAQYHARVMDRLLEEQLQLNIEKNVLETYLAEEAALKIAIEQARINNGTSRFTEK